MIKHFQIAFIVTLLSATVLYGQKSIINYNLSSYKLPDLKRRTFELSFNLNQNRNYSNTRSDYDTTHSHNTSFNLDFTPSYSYYLNRKKVQIESSVSSNPLNFDYSRNYMNSTYNNSNDNEYKSSSYSPFINYNSEHRFYIANKLFLEADLNSYIGYKKNKEENLENDTIQETKRSETTVNTTIPLLIGYGRIEYVDDARLAVYILSDLKKNNRLHKDVSENDITSFAKFLSKLQNERFFDNRNKKIWVIQQIDSFLVVNKIIPKIDALAMALINDNWDYADVPIRKSGFRVSAGVESFYEAKNNENTFPDEINDYNYTSDEQHVYFLGKLVYEKPINLYWQFFVYDEFRAGPSLFTSEYDYNNLTSEENNKYLKLNNDLTTGLGYYPNSRTEINLNFNLNLGKSNRTDISDDAIDESDEGFENSLSYQIELNCKYYLSPQLRINFNCGIDHHYFKSEFEYIPQNSTSYNNYGSVFVNLSLVYKIL